MARSFITHNEAETLTCVKAQDLAESACPIGQPCMGCVFIVHIMYMSMEDALHAGLGTRAAAMQQGGAVACGASRIVMGKHRGCWCAFHGQAVRIIHVSSMHGLHD